MPATGITVDRRLAQGWNIRCAKSQHAQCESADCKCYCHTNPEKLEHYAEAARRANDARKREPSDGETPPARAPKETPPKRPEIKTGRKSPIPVAAAKQIKSEFGFLLWAVDGLVAGAEKIPQWTPEDRLQPPELSALVDATYNELEARAPWLLRYLAKAQESAPEAALIYTVAMIALPRLARREAVVMGVKITPEFARAVVIAPLIAQSVANQSAPAGVAPEPASQRDRPDGNGQIDVGGAPAAGAAVQAGAAQQAGFGDLRHGPDHTNGAWAAGHAP